MAIYHAGKIVICAVDCRKSSTFAPCKTQHLLLVLRQQTRRRQPAALLHQHISSRSAQPKADLERLGDLVDQPLFVVVLALPVELRAGHLHILGSGEFRLCIGVANFIAATTFWPVSMQASFATLTAA